jgi:hypothetical protein
LTDGHEKRTSATTSTLSTSDVPGHSSFIITDFSPFDWRTPQNDNLWQGVSGTNNPCPAGFRLPTITELNTERLSWSSDDAAGAFASPLKLVVAGYRDRFNGSGSIYGAGSLAFYWSGTVDGSISCNVHFENSGSTMNSSNRAYGFSIRCLKD